MSIFDSTFLLTCIRTISIKAIFLIISLLLIACKHTFNRKRENIYEKLIFSRIASEMKWMSSMLIVVASFRAPNWWYCIYKNIYEIYRILLKVNQWNFCVHELDLVCICMYELLCWCVVFAIELFFFLRTNFRSKTFDESEAQMKRYKKKWKDNEILNSKGIHGNKIERTCMKKTKKKKKINSRKSAHKCANVIIFAIRRLIRIKSSTYHLETIWFI